MKKSLSWLCLALICGVLIFSAFASEIFMETVALETTEVLPQIAASIQ